MELNNGQPELSEIFFSSLDVQMLKIRGFALGAEMVQERGSACAGIF